MTHQIKAVPIGYHTLTPHLIVKGADQGIEFYKKAFGAKEIARVPGPDGKSLRTFCAEPEALRPRGALNRFRNLAGLLQRGTTCVAPPRRSKLPTNWR
jgi:hypothetical protein